MKRALEVLNKLVAEGVIRDYAIGGAMGATFYLEPISTMDLDMEWESFDKGRFMDILARHGLSGRVSA